MHTRAEFVVASRRSALLAVALRQTLRTKQYSKANKILESFYGLNT